MLKTRISPDTRTFLENVRWEVFFEFAEQRRGSVPRMTFDEGVLELMVHYDNTKISDA